MSVPIQTVNRNSPAYAAGMRAGDRLLSINGHMIRDVLDYKFYSYDTKLSVCYARQDGQELAVRLKKDEGQDLGLVFTSYLMDNPRSCSNKCIFCFVDQLPPGMRKTLYFKDDDARLSFLLGNYVSLTNLSQDDIQRIIDMRISPINISVHATQPELRAKLLGNPRGADGYRIMRQLAAGGIMMKCQIVLCPGVNDKENLERTLTDLAALAPQVSSVSVVPVGLTRYREKLYPLRAVTKAEARRVIETVDRFGRLCLAGGDSRVFFCADEMYLKAGLALPDAPYYEDYPQIENGVGMLTSFKDEFLSALKQEDVSSDSSTVSIATGMASLPFMQGLIDAMGQKRPKLICHVYGIQNTFFGDTIDVSGLLTGGDVITQLQGKELGERLLIPDVMLRHSNDLFLDDVSLEEVEKELGVHVRPLPVDGGTLLDELLGID